MVIEIVESDFGCMLQGVYLGLLNATEELSLFSALANTMDERIVYQFIPDAVVNFRKHRCDQCNSSLRVDR